MAITTGSGHKLYVSAAAPATFDQTGWEAVSGWELTPCMTEIPEIVKKLAQVDFECLFTGTTDVARGIAEPIPLDIPFRDEPANAGQIIVKAAFDAVEGSPAELLSVKVTNKADTQQVYLQVKVFDYGTGQRVVGETFMRVVKIVADAATHTEVNA